MFERPIDRFETDLCPAGGRAVLLLARREGLGSETRLYRSRDEGTSFEPIAAPDRIHAIAAQTGRCVVATSDALHEFHDDGERWSTTPLGGSTGWGALALVGDEVWVAGDDRVIGCASGTTAVKWKLPRKGKELLSGLMPLDGGGVLVTSNAGRILRGREVLADLEDWSQGLPLLHAGAGSASLGRVAGVWLAGLGGLYARRDSDPAWTLLPGDAEPDGSWLDAIRWLAPTESAQWASLSWQADEWVGTDGANLITGGPGRAPSFVWRRPDGRTSIKGLAVAESAVYASLRNATPAMAGVAVRRNGAQVLRLG
jgi:hypothetical protein